MYAYIEQVGIENFRVFREKIYFDFTKINVLIGTNSSGKSSLIKAFYLMHKCFGNGKIKDILDIEEVLSVLGDFSKLPNKHAQTSVISFYLPIVLRGIPDIMELKISYSLMPNSINQGRLTEISIFSQKKAETNDVNSPIYSLSKDLLTNRSVNKIDFKFFIEEYQRELKQIGKYSENLETPKSKFENTNESEKIQVLTKTYPNGKVEEYIVHKASDAFQTSHPYYFNYKRGIEKKLNLTDSRLPLKYRPFFDKYPGFFNEQNFSRLDKIYDYAKSANTNKEPHQIDIIRLTNGKDNTSFFKRKFLLALGKIIQEKFIYNLEIHSLNQDKSLTDCMYLQSYLWDIVFSENCLWGDFITGEEHEGIGERIYNSLFDSSNYMLKINNWTVDLDKLFDPKIFLELCDILEDAIKDAKEKVFKRDFLVENASLIKIDVRYNNKFFENFIFDNVEYSINEAISKFDNCYFLGSYRNQVQRAYTFKEGTEFQQLLKNILIADEDGRKKKIVNRIKKYLRLFDIAYDFKIERESESQGLYIYLWEIGQKDKTLLADLGYGVSQVLPLIFKIISVALEPGENKKLFIEEPESNLHPALQSKLAELFADAVAHFDIQFFIETHSEYFVRRLQVLTANTYAKNNKDGRFPILNSADTNIYYFNHQDKLKQGEAQIYKINIEKDGALTKNFGKGFFDESSKLNIALYQFSKASKN